MLEWQILKFLLIMSFLRPDKSSYVQISFLTVILAYFNGAYPTMGWI